MVSRDTSLSLLTDTLNALALRQRATIANITNVDTPGYRAVKVSFEDQLRSALGHLDSANGTPAHTAQNATGGDPTVKALVTRQADQFTRVDGNSVQVDQEMSSLMETSMKYSAMARAVQNKLNILRSVITSGQS